MRATTVSSAANRLTLHNHRQHGLGKLVRTTTAACAVTTLFLAGCATAVPAYQPSYDNVKELQADHIKPASVDTFNGGPSSITIRGVNEAKSPVGDNFASYVQNALTQELQKAQLLVLSSAYHIQGKVLDTDIDTGMATGHTTLKVEFTLTKSGTEIYRKVLSAQYSWDSSFVGAIAIPRGIQSYPKVVELLLKQLYADPGFIKALG